MEKVAWHEAIRYTASGFIRLALTPFLYLFGRGGGRYAKNLRAIRDAFNEDAGKVRLLLLLSPT